VCATVRIKPQLWSLTAKRSIGVLEKGWAAPWR
jgi:hypothetical protein